MKKNIIIAIFIILIVAVSFFFVFRTKKIDTTEVPSSVKITEPATEEPTKKSEIITENEDTQPIKQESPFIKPETDRFDVETKDGAVSIVNIYKKSVADASFNGVIFKDNNLYYIAYYPNPEGFIITINNSDIERARAAAEKDFIETLKISKSDACKLNISLAVPMSVRESIAGQNFGLSFCPDGKAFPK